MITRAEATAAAVGRHQVWVTAALMGQATMAADEATAAARVLGLGPEVAEALQEMPMKGLLDDAVPMDPLIYRFHEITQVLRRVVWAWAWFQRFLPVRSWCYRLWEASGDHPAAAVFLKYSSA